MKRTSYGIALAICGLAASTTMAQPPGGGRGPGGPGGSPLERMTKLFDLADADKDGMLTKAELQAAIQAEIGSQNGHRGPGRQSPPPPRDGQEPRGPGGPDGERRGPGGPGAEHRGPGGPGAEHRGPGGPDGERRGPGGTPPRPGEILPGFVIDSLGLSDEQKAKLTALQKEVDKQLASILTVEQKQEMESHRPPQHGPGHDADQNTERNSDRPQRRQRPQ